MTATTPDLPVYAPGDTAGTSDWEYEYDDSQTEEFYFTIDLPVEPPPKRRRTIAQKARVIETPETTPGPRQSQHPINSSTRQPQETVAQKHDPLRITGLHTTSPLVEYRNERYDCRWTTDLGTQIHVGRPGSAPRPHRSGHAVDIVALSRVRLTGSPSTASPAPAPDVSAGQSAGQAIVLDDDEDENGPTSHGNASNGQPVLSFLERVAEIQRRKERHPGSDRRGSQAADSTPVDGSSLPAQAT